MGVFEGITHSEEINELLSDAQQKYDSAVEKMESQKRNTTKSLESLGKQKIKAWSKDMDGFLGSFGAFNSVQMVCKLDERFDFVGKNTNPNELMVNMRQATLTANEVFQNGALSIGTGALVGIATYGGVAMFAKASTGTAIATLSGVAKKNATLAWLGGGSIKAGGLGMAGGKIVLGGVVVTAIVGVSAILAAAKGKEKLAEAKKVHAEAENAVSKMNVVITGMEGIQKVSDNYTDFIQKLSKLFHPYLKEMDRIADSYPKGADGKVDFDALSEMEQRTLHLSWLLAQLYYHVLSVPLLTDDGNVNPTSRQLLNTAQNEYAKLSGEAVKLENEKKQIKELLASAKSVYASSTGGFANKKNKVCVELQKIGKDRLDLWNSTFAPIMGTLSNIEDIDIGNVFQYKITELPIEVIFERVDNSLSAYNRITANNALSIGQNELVEVALYGGTDLFEQIASDENVNASITSARKHEMSLWFNNSLDRSVSDQIIFSGVSGYYIDSVKQVVDNISGRENLAQSQEVNRTVMELNKQIETANNEFDSMLAKIKNVKRCLKRLGNIQKECMNEITVICGKHQLSAGTLSYSQLSESEKRVVEMAMRIAEMQYYILDSSLLSAQNGGIQEITGSISVVDKMIKKIKKDSFSMKEDNLQTSNLLWKKDAQHAMYAGFVCTGLSVLLMILQLISGNLFGLIGILGALISFPIFFYFKNLSQSKLFMWRGIRIALSMIIVLGVEIIGMVV